jgi:hypothetical protein
MAKTIFSAGVRVTSQWLNGSQAISFDGADEDWHYPPLTNDAVQLTGDGGFDQIFITTQTNQDNISGQKTWIAQNRFTDELIAPGATTFWVNNLTEGQDQGVYLDSNPNRVVTNRVLLDYFGTIDGGNIG